jgi:hypothetical protein
MHSARVEALYELAQAIVAAGDRKSCRRERCIPQQEAFAKAATEAQPDALRRTV